MNNQGLFVKETAPKGVYIYTESGNLLLPKFWGLYENTEKPVAAAIIADRNLLVALEGSETSLVLLDWEKELKSAKFESFEDALKDDKGEEATTQLAEMGSPAALFCTNYQCGQIEASKWYLPTLADFQLMHDNKKVLDIALSICGGNAIEVYDYHWTSTRRYDKSHFILYWGDGYRSSSSQYYDNRVRPVSAFL